MKLSAPTLRSVAAFTLVEVLMAATILTVGFMGLIQAVTISSNMMDAARRQTLAASILSHELEKVRLLTWDDPSSTNDVVGIMAGPIDIGIDAYFDEARRAVGDNLTTSSPVRFTHVYRSAQTIATDLQEISVRVTWEVTTSRRDNSDNPVIFTYSRVNSTYVGKNGLNLAYQR